jgi:hypothetical protein
MLEQAERTMKKLFSEIFDMLFVLILCFLTLLIPMLMQGQVIVGASGSGHMQYAFYLPTFLIAAALVVAYIGFILRQSDRELRPMINEMYPGSQPDAGGDEQRDEGGAGR